jgi:hypothetical protein
MVVQTVRPLASPNSAVNPEKTAVVAAAVQNESPASPIKTSNALILW